MRIGKETGSVINAIIENSKFVKLEVGMDATQLHWSDRSAWRVVEVDPDGKGCTLQRYAPKLIGDYYAQNYQYEDENGNPLLRNMFMKLRYRHNSWKYCMGYPYEGQWTKINMCFGCRDEYEDPSF